VLKFSRGTACLHVVQAIFNSSIGNIMHSVTVEKQPDTPVVISLFNSEWQMSRDVDQYAQEVIQVLDGVDEDCYHVMNLLATKFNVGDVILGANTAARGAAAFMHHPRSKTVVVVTTDTITAMAARGLKSPVFGSVPMEVFDSLDEAMAWVDAEIDRAS
jgi:hypothetical protein